MNFSDELAIKYCCESAWEAQTLSLPNPSVCAIILNKNGDILGKGVHKIAGSPHAEILALKEAYFHLTNDERVLKLTQSEDLHTFLRANHHHIFSQCRLFVSLEPCNHHGKTPPCAALIAILGFECVYIGTRDTHTLASGGMQRLIESGTRVEIFDLQMAKNVLLPFDIWRKKGRFVLFKLAQRLNGAYKNGIISGKKSRIFSHNQRSIAQMIGISGTTLLNDKPQLNARYATKPFDASNLPSVCIFTRQDKTFIANKARYLKTTQKANETIETTREIIILQDIKAFEALKGFIIIEGGFNLLSALRKQVDMLLIHQSLSLQDSQINLRLQCENLHFTYLHCSDFNEDIGIWLC